MRKQFMLMLLCFILIFSFSACTGSKDENNSAEELQVTTSEEKQKESSTEEIIQEENTESDNSQSEEKSTGVFEDTTGEETGNFKGLEVEDEFEITLNEGEAVAGE